MKSFIWKFPKIKETLSRMIATGHHKFIKATKGIHFFKNQKRIQKIQLLLNYLYKTEINLSQIGEQLLTTKLLIVENRNIDNKKIKKMIIIIFIKKAKKIKR
jgi:hypothetical protein